MEMLRKLIQKIKENKALLLIIGGIVILILLFVFDLSRLQEDEDSTTQTPLIVNPDKRVDPTVTLIFLSAMPQNGENYSTLDPFQPITFEFSQPVDPETVDLKIFPFIEHNLRVLENDPSKALLMPRDSGWVPHVEYLIEIKDIKSVSGVSLEGSVKYIYKNDPPELDFNDLPY